MWDLIIHSEKRDKQAGVRYILLTTLIDKPIDQN